MKQFQGGSFVKRLLFLTVAVSGFLFSAAQLCAGSLGDPVVNITFGTVSNGDPGVAPPAGYTYTSSSCPDDGYYTITRSTSGCFGNSWHTVNADHTGNGAFMLVNASFQAGDFYVGRVTGLCPNTTYEFSAWLMNVLLSPSGIQPNITFTIETPSGTVLNQFNTGGIPVTAQPRWDQYGFYFTTTAGSPDIILRMRNNAPGGMGNDIALDDITFRPCGPVVAASLQGSNTTINVCKDEQQLSYDFGATISPGFVSPVYQWQVSTDSGRVWRDIPGASSLTYQRLPTAAGIYWYRLTVAENGNAGIVACRIASNVNMIHVHDDPVITAGPDKTIVRGEQIILTAANASGGSTVFGWSPADHLDDDSILNPVASPASNTLYTLSAVSAFGCRSEDQVLIKVVAGIFVPSAFTPGNDGKNDYWQIPFLDPAKGAAVSVYNRNGQLVYHVKGAVVNWDGRYNGTPQPSGLYIYHVRFNDGKADLKGTITLIR